MTPEELLSRIEALPPEGRKLVETLVTSLRERFDQAPKPPTEPRLKDEEFVGMWRDRDDIEDGSAWVRAVRRSEWRN